MDKATLAINAIKGTKNMSSLIKMADTKEDMQLIVQTMLDELQAASKEIDEL